MKVVLLGPYPPPHGGVQTNLVGIRDHLRQCGAAVSVINLTRFRGRQGDDVYYPRNAFEVLRLLRLLRADILHIHLGGRLTRRLLGLCMSCSLVPGARTVLTFHSGGYPTWPEGRAARRRSLRGFVFRRLDAVIAVNAAIVELFRRFGVPQHRIRLIPPNVPAVVDPQASLPGPLAGFFQNHDPVLATVGLLEPEYDLTLQIEALGRIREFHPGAGLAIIGAGSLEEDLRRTIAAQPWGDHILLCGDTPRSVALLAIAGSRLLLRTTRYDGDSVAVREALALGTPVIASDNGMRPEGVDLVPAGDLAALCQAILRRLAAPSPAARRLADPGRRNLEAVVGVYRELMNSK